MSGQTTPTGAAVGVGSTLTTTKGDRVTLHAVIPNLNLTKLGGLPPPAPPAGDVYVGLDIEGCAQKANTLSMSGLWWHVVDTPGNNYAPSLLASQAVATPLTTASEYVAVGQCSRGTLVFEIPTGTKVGRVLYEPGPFEKDYWTVG